MPAWVIYSHAASEYNKATTQSSALCRSTAYGLLATVWLYAGGLTVSGKFDTTLTFVESHAWLNTCLILLLICIGLDFVQYSITSLLMLWWRRNVHLLVEPHVAADLQRRSVEAWTGTYVGRYLRRSIEASPEYASLHIAPGTPWNFTELSGKLRDAGGGPLDRKIFPGSFNIVINSIFWAKHVVLIVAFVALVAELS